jgi:hypothetical protein
MDTDIVVGLMVPEDREEGIYYFSSEHSRSEAGIAIANHVSDRLGVRSYGRTLPILKETRSPAIVVALRSMNRRSGKVIANAIASLYESTQNVS